MGGVWVVSQPRMMPSSVGGNERSFPPPSGSGSDDELASMARGQAKTFSGTLDCNLGVAASAVPAGREIDDTAHPLRASGQRTSTCCVSLKVDL